ncbi:lysylphosphatidylglycerol synthase transmembrane domain-containing protein [Pseudonocardia lacus]|uniref:lysylphosphatidylglycerol synthase transmembrane domain-containing protein n=1 Tax=Pseudonocardia lacus TaxID=2835865 RepID=UPI001BDC5D83|nr:YbhN family protein [Pseudonocardia lacus]
MLDAAALGVVLAGTGHPADPLELFVAYALPGVLGVLPLTPGGIDVVEGVLVPALVGFGTPLEAAAVAVLGWRLVSYWAPIPVGALAWLTLRHRAPAPGRGRWTTRTGPTPLARGTSDTGPGSGTTRPWRDADAQPP